jgi:hypothetical protein
MHLNNIIVYFLCKCNSPPPPHIFPSRLEEGPPPLPPWYTKYVLVYDEKSLLFGEKKSLFFGVLYVFIICNINVLFLGNRNYSEITFPKKEKKKLLKVWWHAATLFVYFIFFLHYMAANGYI